ncbi:hypothetical protein NHQ30_000318 [Ciborinia camelliae]|nr:hypothetical protein NHQ30_000318 [Ciborinia camelliae]
MASKSDQTIDDISENGARVSLNEKSSMHHTGEIVLLSEPENPEAASVPTSTLEVAQKSITYLQGPRLHLISLAIWVVIFLPNMEISIVGTSLVTITNDFHGFSQTSWIVSAYQLTYTSFLVVWAKMSDIFGRKWTLNLAIAVFVIFSGACGASQSMSQLIVFRAFQGIGASGVFSISTSIMYELIPKEKLPIYGAITFATVALATVTGPLLGGAIDTRTTWRWVFLVNCPIGVCVLALITMVMPAKFPYHGAENSKPTEEKFRLLLKRIDFIGAILLLGGSVFLVTALLEASAAFAWSSGTIIALLVLSGVAWIAFFAWEYHLSGRQNTTQEPIFPWQFLQNHIWIGVLMILVCPRRVLNSYPLADVRLLAMASSLFLQFRMLGSAIGVAVSGSVINSYIKSHLSSILSAVQLDQLLQDLSVIQSLEPNTQSIIEGVFDKSYGIIFKIVAALAAVQFVSVVLMWKKPNLVLKN